MYFSLVINVNVLIFVQTVIFYQQIQLSSAIALSGHNIRDAKDLEFPFVVSIGLKNYENAERNHVCTGALISESHVLTAAHCFTSLKVTDIIRVTIGSSDLRKGLVFYSTKRITYDQWARWHLFAYTPGKNDIAILKLTDKIYPDAIIQPAKLWTGRIAELYNRTATVVGWGYTNDVEDTSLILQTASVRIISNKDTCKNAKEINPYNYTPHPRQIYTNAVPHVLLECGDSGGPLIYGRNTIVGINMGTCPTTSPSKNVTQEQLNKHQMNAHVSVAAYSSFIKHCLDNF